MMTLLCIHFYTDPAITSDPVAAAIGGGVGGGILLLLILLCICVCICCLCKKSKRKATTKTTYQPLPKLSENSSGGGKIIVIHETRTQNVILPTADYTQDPYYNHPQNEPYPVSYAIPPDDIAFPQSQYQSYTDPNSCLQGSPNAAPFNVMGIPGQFGGSSFQQGP